MIDRHSTYFSRPAISAALVLLILCLSSCFKEKAITIPTSTLGTTYTANMGENYTQQLYFNIQSGQWVDSNSKFDYDLAFDCSEFTGNVWVNGAKLMLVCRTGKTSLETASLADTIRGWRVEYGSGIASDNAIGDWGYATGSRGEVYIISLGEDSLNINLGYKKLQINGYSPKNGYQITYCNMDGSGLRSALITKKPNRNQIYFSLRDNASHDLEPEMSSWDLLFTQYSVLFDDRGHPLPYKVTGVLTNQNPDRTQAYFLDSTTAFSKINIAQLNPSSLSPMRDGIGYLWKKYEYGEYSTDTAKNYIVKSENRYYKLRFLDFYDPKTKKKGYPKFEYVELK